MTFHTIDMASELFIRFFPIFFLLALGFVFNRTGLLPDQAVGSLKNLIVMGGLPAILFLSFLTMEIRLSSLLLFSLVFLVCLLLFGAGALFQKSGLSPYPLSPFFFTGFEFGMVGVALFTSLFGPENLPSILLLGLGHEFFIWFVYAPLLESQNHEKTSLKRILSSFLKSPIILAILSALLLNLTGIYERIAPLAISRGVVESARMLSQIVTPLILLTIGSQLRFDRIEKGAALRLIGLRLVSVAAAGLALGWVTNRWIMELDRMMVYAFIIFFLIPPPFIIPVFLGKEKEKESRFYNNILIIYTPVTLILLMGIMAFLGI